MPMGEGMLLVFHGGLCCGIKTVYNMGYKPEDSHKELKAVPRDDRDKNGFDTSSKDRFFHLEAPKETGKERLQRYIEYMKKYRPQNILEVCLASSYSKDYNQIHNWGPVLEEFGFKCVTKATNSNSSNTVAIYHLVIDEGSPDDDEDDDYDSCDCDDCRAERGEAPW